MRKKTTVLLCMLVGVTTGPAFSADTEIVSKPKSRAAQTAGFIVGAAISGIGTKYGIQDCGLDHWTKAGCVAGASVAGGIVGLLVARLFGDSGKSDIEIYEQAERFVDRVKKSKFMVVPRPKLLESIGADHSSVTNAYDYFCGLEKQLLQEWSAVDSLLRKLSENDDEWSCDLQALCRKLAKELDVMREEIKARKGLVTDKFEFSSAGEALTALEARARVALAKEFIVCAVDSYQKMIAHGLTVSDKLVSVLGALRVLAREIIDISQKCVEKREWCKSKVNVDPRYLDLAKQYDALMVAVRQPLDILEQRVTELFSSEAYKEEQTALEEERYHDGVINIIQGIRNEMANMIARFGVDMAGIAEDIDGMEAALKKNKDRLTMVERFLQGQFETLMASLNVVNTNASASIEQNNRIEANIASIIGMISMIENTMGTINHKLENMGASSGHHQGH